MMNTVFSSEVLETGTLVVRAFGKWGVVSASYRPWDLGYCQIDLLNRLGGRLDGTLGCGFLKSFAEKEKIDPESVFLLPTQFRRFLDYVAEEEGGEFKEIFGNLELFSLPR